MADVEPANDGPAATVMPALATRVGLVSVGARDDRHQAERECLRSLASETAT
jgi:hypothetical protein